MTTNHIQSKKSYQELLLALIQVAIGDIIFHAKECNPIGIISVLSLDKKNNLRKPNLINQWHPGEYDGAYDFLFSDEPIFRVIDKNKNEEIDCSLLALSSHLSNDNNIIFIRDALKKQIANELGFFPLKSIPIRVNIIGKQKEYNMEKLEKKLYDKLVELTKKGKLEWKLVTDKDIKKNKDILKEKTEEEKAKLVLQDCYTAKLTSEKEYQTLTCDLFKYSKSTHAKKNYSEYFINIQLANEDEGLQVVQGRGMRNLWQQVSKSGNTEVTAHAIKQVNKFLDGLC